MSTTSRDPIDELADLAARTGKDARRVLAGPDGPLALALVLALVAMAEVTIYADEIGAGDDREPARDAPARARAPAPRAGRRARSSSASSLAISAEADTLTIAALVGLVTVLYLFALDLPAALVGAPACSRSS